MRLIHALGLRGSKGASPADSLWTVAVSVSPAYGVTRGVLPDRLSYALRRNPQPGGILPNTLTAL